MTIVSKDINTQNLNDLWSPLVSLPAAGDHIRENLGSPFLGFDAHHNGDSLLSQTRFFDDFLNFDPLHDQGLYTVREICQGKFL